MINNKLHAILFVSLLILFFSCSSTPLPKSGSVSVPEDFFGMVHAGERKSSEEYSLLDEMGVEWILATFYWSQMEGKQGEFDFSERDEYVDAAIKNNKKIVAVLAYDTPWLYPDGKTRRNITPDNLPHFLNFVEKVIDHYRDRVDVWEIWNEPNILFWKGTRKDFFALSIATAEKIREIHPEAYIIGGAYWRTPKGFIKAMNKAGGMKNLDGIAFHPYALNPVGSMQVYDKFIKVLDDINFNGPVWITEVGYPTGGWPVIKVHEEKLPSYVVKTIAGAAARDAKVLLWYELFDGYNYGEIPAKKLSLTRITERTYGLTYPDYKRKNGAWAYKLCARFLPGSRYVPELPAWQKKPSNIVSFCFLGGSSGYNTLILWNDRNRLGRAELQLSSQAIIHDISNGKERAFTPNTVLEIGNVPLIITWQGNEIPRLSLKK